ncbi:MAG: Hsp20/alpha crystallin family protein [Acidobacteriota bacterium]
MSNQWNPLRDLVMLQDRMNRLFEDATDRRERVSTDESDAIETAEWYPTADLYDVDGAYLIAVDLPGIDRASLDISLDDNKLTIRGIRTIEGVSAARSERPRGRFLRTFNVPALVDQQTIQADYNNGVLEVRLPKRKEQQAERIKINVN